MTTTSANGQYHRVVLPNGLRILVAPMPHTRSATVGLFFGTGSRYESYEQAGIAHFFEHMLFKGSAQYPSAQVIAETIEGVGGILNAGTDKELTVYWAKVASAHLPKAFDLLTDMVRAPLFDEAEVVKERRVVLEELNAITGWIPDEFVLLGSNHAHGSLVFIVFAIEMIASLIRCQRISLHRLRYWNIAQIQQRGHHIA